MPIVEPTLTKIFLLKFLISFVNRLWLCEGSRAHIVEIALVFLLLSVCIRIILFSLVLCFCKKYGIQNGVPIVEPAFKV